jgi:aminomethyltransferase
MSDQASLKQTPLNATHRELGARMVDFGGWDMPVNYGSQIEEHHTVRSGCGLFDVSHMLPLDIKGANVRAFLRRLVANNVDKLQVSGKALYSCMLNEAGGVIDDLIIYFMDENWFRLVVNAGTAEKDLAWMEKMNADWGMGLSLTPRRDLAMIAIQGPNATQALNEALPGVEQIIASLKPFNAAAMGEMFIARTGYTGEDGFEVMVLAKSAPFFWRALMEAGGKPIGLGARDTLRLEAGMNLYGQDMDETTSAAGIRPGLDRRPEDRTRLRRPRRAGKERGDQTARRPAAAGQGRAAQSPKSHHQKRRRRNHFRHLLAYLQQSIALARIPLGIAPGDEVEVEIRDKKLKAAVVKYPFVRNGKF